MNALSGCDVLVTPTIATAAIPLHEVDQSTTPALFTRAANYLGLCAVTVPNGLTASGLPTSFQIIGRPHTEPLILRIAANLERLAGGRFPIPNVEKLVRD
jgi:aspartyl-tRNA(Asn)/glutamyl-tRNA(Gln) amidotransferase subunit A